MRHTDGETTLSVVRSELVGFFNIKELKDFPQTKHQFQIEKCFKNLRLEPVFEKQKNRVYSTKTVGFSTLFGAALHRCPYSFYQKLLSPAIPKFLLPSGSISSIMPAKEYEQLLESLVEQLVESGFN